MTYPATHYGDALWRQLLDTAAHKWASAQGVIEVWAKPSEPVWVRQLPGFGIVTPRHRNVRGLHIRTIFSLESPAADSGYRKAWPRERAQ